MVAFTAARLKGTLPPGTVLGNPGSTQAAGQAITLAQLAAALVGTGVIQAVATLPAPTAGTGAVTVTGVATGPIAAGSFVTFGGNEAGVMGVALADSTDGTTPAQGWTQSGAAGGASIIVSPPGTPNSFITSPALVPGTVYYLGTAGAATATPPSAPGTLRQVLGVAVNTTTVLMGTDIGIVN
jgi:hypothetical protein